MLKSDIVVYLGKTLKRRRVHALMTAVVVLLLDAINVGTMCKSQEIV